VLEALREREYREVRIWKSTEVRTRVGPLGHKRMYRVIHVEASSPMIRGGGWQTLYD